MQVAEHQPGSGAEPRRGVGGRAPKKKKKNGGLGGGGAPPQKITKIISFQIRQTNTLTFLMFTFASLYSFSSFSIYLSNLRAKLLGEPCIAQSSGLCYFVAQISTHIKSFNQVLQKINTKYILSYAYN